jgi:hypothetical protein
MNTNIPLEIGRHYSVRHSRKGNFCIEVTDLSDPWITGNIISGTAKAIMDYNVREAGESITIRDEHSYFSALPMHAL